MSKTILVLEENSVVHGLVAAALDLEGVSLQHEFDPEQFVAKARDVRPDLILISNADQGRDYAICRGLMADASLAAVPRLLLANSKDTIPEAQLQALNIKGVVRKPFEASDLQQQISKHLDLSDYLGASAEYRRSQSTGEEAAHPLDGVRVLDGEVLGLMRDEQMAPEETGVPDVDFTHELEREGAIPGALAGGDAEEIEGSLYGDLPLHGEDFDEASLFETGGPAAAPQVPFEGESSLPADEAAWSAAPRQAMEEMGAGDLLESQSAPAPAPMDQSLARGSTPQTVASPLSLEVELKEGAADFEGMGRDLAGGVSLFEAPVNAPAAKAAAPTPPPAFEGEEEAPLDFGVDAMAEGEALEFGGLSGQMAGLEAVEEEAAFEEAGLEAELDEQLNIGLDEPQPETAGFEGAGQAETASFEEAGQEEALFGGGLEAEEEPAAFYGQDEGLTVSPDAETEAMRSLFQEDEGLQLGGLDETGEAGLAEETAALEGFEDMEMAEPEEGEMPAAIRRMVEMKPVLSMSEDERRQAFGQEGGEESDATFSPSDEELNRMADQMASGELELGHEEAGMMFEEEPEETEEEPALAGSGFDLEEERADISGFGLDEAPAASAGFDERGFFEAADLEGRPAESLAGFGAEVDEERVEEALQASLEEYGEAEAEIPSFEEEQVEGEIALAEDGESFTLPPEDLDRGASTLDERLQALEEETLEGLEEVEDEMEAMEQASQPLAHSPARQAVEQDLSIEFGSADASVFGEEGGWEEPSLQAAAPQEPVEEEGWEEPSGGSSLFEAEPEEPVSLEGASFGQEASLLDELAEKEGVGGEMDFDTLFDEMRADITANPVGERLEDVLKREKVLDAVRELDLVLPSDERIFSRGVGIYQLAPSAEEEETGLAGADFGAMALEEEALPAGEEAEWGGDIPSMDDSLFSGEETGLESALEAGYDEGYASGGAQVQQAVADMDFGLEEPPGRMSRGVGIYDLPAGESEDSLPDEQPQAGPFQEEPPQGAGNAPFGGDAFSDMGFETEDELTDVLDEVISSSVRKALEEEVPKVMEKIRKDEGRHGA